MKMLTLDTLFDIKYGNQFDLNKLVTNENSTINFVSRSSQNLGVVCKVDAFKNIEPFPPGLITVTLGGCYLLSSFVQQEKFYTAQNIKILFPKSEMTFEEKIFYCQAIELNRFRYYSHGREANKTLDKILVPDKMPSNLEKIKFDGLYKNKQSSILKDKIHINSNNWEYFKLIDLFYIEKGNNYQINNTEVGKIPLISSISDNNGVTKYIEADEFFEKNKITLSINGNVCEAFYQENEFCTTTDIIVLNPKFQLNKYNGLFFSALIKEEKNKYNYSRKLTTDRLNKLKIKIPIKDKQPDLNYIDILIKSLPYTQEI